MKPLPVKVVISILEQNGFFLSRQSGSHFIYTNEETKATVIIASHGKNKQIPIGTFLAIVKQSKLPLKKFQRR